MFETSLVESSGQLRSKTNRYMWVTGAFNAAVVTVMVLLPLLYPEALPRATLSAMLTAPPPPPAAAPLRPVVAVKAARRTAPLDAFTAPSRVPTNVDRTHEDPPASAVGSVFTGTAALPADSFGPAGALGFGTPVPAVVRVAVPRAVAPAHVSSGVVAGNRLFGPSPAYPPIAKAAHVSGSVVLHAIISKTGAIQSLSVVSGPEMLRASAVAAVEQWKYKPYLLNGEATDVDTTITVNFSFGA